MVICGLYLILSTLIVICTCLPLRCLLSDMYDNLFNMVIMLSSLISRLLIYTFLFLNIIISFKSLFVDICCISAKSYPLG